MSKTLLLLLSVGFGAVASAAEPILVPDFTPGTPQEFAITAMLQSQVNDRLLQDGHILLTSEVVVPVVGQAAITNCAALPSCPGAVFPRLPTRVALVVRVDRLGGTLVGHFELYEQSNPNPLVVREIPIAAGNEHLFAHEVASAAGALVLQLGPSPDAVLMAAARLIAGQNPSAMPLASADLPTAAPAPQPSPPTLPAPAPVAAMPPAPMSPRPPPGVTDLDAEPSANRSAGATSATLEGTGVAPRHLLGSRKHFEKSKMDPRDWLYKAMPHAGRFTFEVRAGLGMGDVDRQADIRVTRERGATGDQWYQEGPMTARRSMGGVFVGYAPATMIDLGVAVGLQYGGRRFSTGYAQLGLDGSVTEVQDTQVVDAVQLWIQPRLRGYLVPTGPAKPFLFSGAEFRVFDKYDFEQPLSFEYPQPPGGMVPGWVGGGGMMIDPSPIVGFFFEASYTLHFGDRADLFPTGVWNYTIPAASGSTGYTVGLTGGVQFRI